MGVLRQLVFLLPPMLALVNPRAATLHCPNLFHATQQSSNVSAKLILTVVTQIAAVESELNTWQNATIHILKRFLLENTGKEI